MAWTSLSFAYGSVLTSTKMTQIYDNFDAMATKASGAPNVLATTVTPASQATMEAGTNNDTAVTALSANWHPGAAKAWGYVTVSAGAPTLQASWNITSITDAGVGQLTATIATDFSSTNYAALCLCRNPNYTLGGAISEEIDTGFVARSAGTIRFACWQNGAMADPTNWSFLMFGDQ